MDLNIILAIITLILLVGMGVVLFLYPFGVKPDEVHKKAEAVVAQAGGRQQAARNQRARMRANAARQRQEALPDEENHADDDHNDDEEVDPFVADAKMGAKKRAKLEAKAEKKAAREAEELLREEKKAKEALKEEERKKQSEKEKEEELKREEDEKREIEEREKKELEEYLQMKAAFSVEGEGFEEEDDDNAEKNLLQEFIQYIKANKVVVIEDLAGHFKLKTQAAIDRITTLQADGQLTGVVDDRGKFIYISQEELENVAKFIKQRGRVSITDLVECSNRLINLVPVSVQN